MNNKVLPVINKTTNIAEPIEGVEHVMIGRTARAGGIEEFRHLARAPWRGF